MMQETSSIATNCTKKINRGKSCKTFGAFTTVPKIITQPFPKAGKHDIAVTSSSFSRPNVLYILFSRLHFTFAAYTIHPRRRPRDVVGDDDIKILIGLRRVLGVVRLMQGPSAQR